MSSMPTDSRTRSGRDAGGQLFFGGQLLVRGRSRMDHQRLGVSDIGQQAEQLEPVDKPSPAS